MQLCQDQEEERLEFIKGKLWDWANALSTVAMAEDESAERTRTALEQAEPAIDLKVFVRHSGTGNAIPDPPAFVDYALGGAPPKPTFRTAKFIRSTTRNDAIKHSPSNIDDISRAFSSSQIALKDKDKERVQQPQVVASESRNSLAEAVSANSIANSQQYGSQATLAGAAGAGARQAGPASAVGRVSGASEVGRDGGGSRFAVSPGANLRSLADRPARAPSPTGQAPASAFRRSASQEALSVMGAAAPGESVPSVAYEAPAPAAPVGGGGAEEEDPLLQALNKLKLAQNQPRSPIRLPHSSAPPFQQQQYQQQPQASRMTHQASQASLGRVDPTYGGPPRAGSPSLQMMQPPRAASPNALAQQMGRTHSRGGSANGANAFAGVGANGRSPSPQPFQQFPGQGGPANGGPSRPQSGYQPGPPPPQQQQYAQQGYTQQQQQQRVPSPSPTPTAFSPSRGGSHQAYPSAASGFSPAPPPAQSLYGGTPAGYAPPPVQHQQQPSRGYAPTPVAQAQQYQPQASPASPYGPAPSAYGVSAAGGYAPPQQAASPAGYGHPGAAGSGYASSPVRAGSVGPSASLTGYGAPMGGSQAAYGGSPAPQLQQHVQHQATRAPSPAPLPQPAPAVPPSGTYTDEGKPVLFYVSAIYDYQPQSGDEIRFGQGDVIAITHTSQVSQTASGVRPESSEGRCDG